MSNLRAYAESVTRRRDCSWRNSGVSRSAMDAANGSRAIPLCFEAAARSPAYGGRHHGHSRLGSRQPARWQPRGRVLAHGQRVIQRARRGSRRCRQAAWPAASVACCRSFSKPGSAISRSLGSGMAPISRSPRSSCRMSSARSQVQDMANQAGMQKGDFLSQLSQHLPHAVDQMTPNGQVSDEGSMSV